MPGTNPDPDPKAAGMGVDAGSSIDTVIDAHKAVRELLLAMEALPAPAGAPADTFDAFKGQAQVARRRLEDIDADLKAQSSVTSVPGVRVAAGNVTGVPDVHIHIHLNLTLPSFNGAGRSEP
jgi:hypothetical protein